MAHHASHNDRLADAKEIVQDRASMRLVTAPDDALDAQFGPHRFNAGEGGDSRRAWDQPP
jgi:hypothetical protein